jgi:uncharacterized membrane protein YfcA
MLTATALSIALAAAIGGVMGLLGGGGSILTVPMLMAVQGLPERLAMATSLAVVVSTALVSLLPHWRAGNVALRPGLTFAGISAIGALGGGAVSQFIPGQALIIGFALVMAVTGLTMLRDRRAAPTVVQPAKPVRTALAALAAGSLTGLVGAGGGFVIVPALSLLVGLPMRQAVGTSLLIIALQGVAGLVGQLGHTPLEFSAVAPLALASAVGSLIGARFSTAVPAATLKKGFGAMVLVVASWTGLQPLSTLVAACVAGFVAAVLVALAIWDHHRHVVADRGLTAAH